MRQGLQGQRVLPCLLLLLEELNALQLSLQLEVVDYVAAVPSSLLLLHLHLHLHLHLLLLLLLLVVVIVHICHLLEA